MGVRMADVGERLERMEELICSIAERLERVDRPLPHILNRREAARELSISLTVLKGMIRRGEIAESQELGSRRGIPRSEILRLATPTQPKKKPPSGRPPPRAPDARSEAERIRALTKR